MDVQMSASDQGWAYARPVITARRRR